MNRPLVVKDFLEIEPPVCFQCQKRHFRYEACPVKHSYAGPVNGKVCLWCGYVRSGFDAAKGLPEPACSFRDDALKWRARTQAQKVLMRKRRAV